MRSQAVRAEAAEAMAASENALLEARFNSDRTTRQCRIADREVEHRQKASSLLERKLEQWSSLSEHIRSCHERLSCGEAALSDSARSLTSTSLEPDPLELDQMCLQVKIRWSGKGNLERREAVHGWDKAIKTKLAFLNRERNSLETEVEVSRSREDDAERSAHQCRIENDAAVKKTIELQKRYNAAVEGLKEAEVALRRYQEAEFQAHVRCLEARAAVAGSQQLVRRDRNM